MMTTNRSSLNQAAMTNDQLMRVAPSVFATQPWEGMSARYTFIPTIQIVEKMRAEGFQPVSAVQSRARIAGKQEFTKHMIRFRDVRQGDAPVLRQLGQIYPELVLTNSHDGASAYKLDAGLFRLVCLNGLMVEDANIGQMKVRHSGSADGIIEASYSIVEEFPKVLDSVQQFASLRLTAPQQEAFAAAALTLRYDEDKPAPISPVQALRTRRFEDRDANLWNTYNVVQENLVNGGIRTTNNPARRVRTRAVTGIAESSKLNKALWTLTERMKELVAR